uniref:G-protein coupled receptors family 1 profile domain-containing protein n=1 Tax=Cavia porcellus TaxID=10141 RepID=A0A286Y0X8_CAVPO
MAEKKHSTVTEFILSVLTEKPELQIFLFLLFLGIYVITVVGNLGIITLIGLCSPLHTPMYYLLSSLSFIDLCHSTVITPKMLVNFVVEKNISYPECMGHMLAAMAYDCYVATCHFYMLYNVTMSSRVCCWMVAGVYSMDLVGATAHTVCMQRVVFCKPELSSSSTLINERVVLCLSAFNILLPALTILSSYIFIIASILRIRSSSGRSKAFSICSSHISAVAVLSTLFLLHSNPCSPRHDSVDQGRGCFGFYTIIVPVLNPLSYYLQNTNVKVALHKILE